jgi:hypothetical protein
MKFMQSFVSYAFTQLGVRVLQLMLNVIILGTQESDVCAVTLRVLLVNRLVWPVNDVRYIED